MAGDVRGEEGPTVNDLLHRLGERAGTATALLEIGVGIFGEAVSHVVHPGKQYISCKRIVAKLITENVLINIAKNFDLLGDQTCETL